MAINYLNTRGKIVWASRHPCDAQQEDKTGANKGDKERESCCWVEHFDCTTQLMGHAQQQHYRTVERNCDDGAFAFCVVR